MASTVFSPSNRSRYEAKQVNFKNVCGQVKMNVDKVLHPEVKFDQYINVDQTDDIATQELITTFPPEIDIAARCEKSKLEFGALPQFHRYFAILGDTLCLWPYHQTKVTEKYVANLKKDDLIQAVCYCPVDKQVLPNEFTATLAIATSTYLTVLPICKNQLLQEPISTIELNFIPTAMVGGPTGQIFVTDNKGGISVFGFRANGTEIKLSRFCQSEGLATRVLLYALNITKNPKTLLAVNSLGTHLSAIDSAGTLHFYRYSYTSQKLTKIQSFSSEFPFVSICHLSNTETQFLGTTNSAELFIFDFENGGDCCFGGNLKYQKLESLDTPMQVCQGAYSEMGVTVLIGGNIATILRKDIEGQISCASIPLNCQHVNAFAFSNVTLPRFIEANHWQQMGEAPLINFLTSEGNKSYRITFPAMKIIRELFQSKTVSDPNIASAFIVSSLHPIQKDLPMRIAAQITDNRTLANEFITCLSNIFAIFWDVTIFQKKWTFQGEQYKVTKQFRETLPRSTINRIQSVIQIIKDFIRLRQSSASPYQREQINEYLSLFDAIISLADKITDCLRFILIIGEKGNRKLLTQAFNVLKGSDPECAERLVCITFGEFNSNSLPIIINDLHQLSASIVNAAQPSTETAKLTEILTKESKAISTFSKYSEALDELLVLKFLDEDRQLYSRAPVIALLEEIGSPEFNISVICQELISLEMVSSAIEIAIARARFLDPDGLALAWQENGNDDSDVKGKEMFTEVSSCYMAILDSVNIEKELDLLTKSIDDKVFHFILYRRLHKRGLDHHLVSIDSPYIEEYLKLNFPKLIPHHLFAMKQIEKGARALLELADNKKIEATNEERINWRKEAYQALPSLKIEDQKKSEKQ